MDPTTVAHVASAAPPGLDPNFVQHGLDDIAVRFFGYLAFILAYSTVIHGAVRASFAVFGLTNLKDTWWDEVAIAGLGIFFALGFDWNALFYIAGITNDQYVHALPVLREHGSPAGFFPSWLLISSCNVVTGALVIGGRRQILSIAEEFAGGFDAIKKLLSRTTGRGSSSGSDAKTGA